MNLIRMCIFRVGVMIKKVPQNIKTDRRNPIEVNRICSYVNIHSIVYIKALYSSDIRDIKWQHQ